MNKGKIDKVLFSLENYGLNDIRNNKERPIAAFILGACFIRALSNYKYNTVSVSNFVNEYMPMYDGAILSEGLQMLSDFYSLRNSNFRIGFGDRDKEENQLKETIHIEDFIANLEAAFYRFKDEVGKGEIDIEPSFDSNPIIEDYKEKKE